MAFPPRKVDRSGKYNKNIAIMELKRHVSILIVIHPSEKAVKDEDTGHNRECMADSWVAADYSCASKEVEASSVRLDGTEEGQS